MKLADGKARTIQHMVSTTFWHRDGTPISAKQFMELLFGKMPEVFKNEAELRELWSTPETRKDLLKGFAEKGFGQKQLVEMQKIIDAEKSDLFDVLAYVAYALPSLSREERAARAKLAIGHRIRSICPLFPIPELLFIAVVESLTSPNNHCAARSSLNAFSSCTIVGPDNRA